jgi:hypothetical protein
VSQKVSARSCDLEGRTEDAGPRLSPNGDRHVVMAIPRVARFKFKGKLESQVRMPTVACIFGTHQLHRARERGRDTECSNARPDERFFMKLSTGEF